MNLPRREGYQQELKGMQVLVRNCTCLLQFIQSFTRKLLKTYCVPKAVLGPEKRAKLTGWGNEAQISSQTLMLTNQDEESKKRIDSVERKITVLDWSCTLGTPKSLPDVTFQ